VKGFVATRTDQQIGMARTKQTARMSSAGKVPRPDAGRRIEEARKEIERVGGSSGKGLVNESGGKPGGGDEYLMRQMAHS
jgi:hypothetical protein